jgi:hypothetical protein
MWTRRKEALLRVEQSAAHQGDPLPGHPVADGFLVHELHVQAGMELVARCAVDVPEGFGQQPRPIDEHL